MSEFQARVAVMLKSAREDKRIRLPELCLLTGIDMGHLSMFESGEQLPGLESFTKIVRALRADANAILGL